MRALHALVDNLTSNGAHMVMTALAWNLKAWLNRRANSPSAYWTGLASLMLEA